MKRENLKKGQLIKVNYDDKVYTAKVIFNSVSRKAMVLRIYEFGWISRITNLGIIDVMKNYNDSIFDVK